MKKILLLIIPFLVLIAAPRHPSTFTAAKDYSQRLILSEMDNYTIKTLYSQIPLKHSFKLSIPEFPKKPTITIYFIPTEDRYQSSTYESRSHKIEWEHVVPAYWFRTADPLIMEAWDNGHEKCVTSSGKKYKGRQCAQKVSPLFKTMEADMYNLEPSLGSLNAIRRDYSFGMIEGEDRPYGELIDFEIDRDKDIVEPTDNIRGKIARIMIYMYERYGVEFPNHNETMTLMLEWAEKYPITPWEIRKRQILTETYGYEFE